MEKPLNIPSRKWVFSLYSGDDNNGVIIKLPRNQKRQGISLDAKKYPWRFWKHLGALRELGGSEKQLSREDHQKTLEEIFPRGMVRVLEWAGKRKLGYSVGGGRNEQLFSRIRCRSWSPRLGGGCY